MERIMIIGCGGAGKSTLARKLGEKLGIPVIHLDKLWWRENWTHISREAFDAAVAKQVQNESWILDGNYNRTMSLRLPRCDTVIYLDFSRFACLRGVAKRILTTYGQVRPDMGEGCPERFDLEFLLWVWNFNKNNRKGNYDMLSGLSDKEIYILKNRRQVNAFLGQINPQR